MAVAEVYEALTSRPPGKRSWTHKQAIADITGMAGSRLDLTVVKAFLEEEATFSAVAHTWRDDP
jgi:HD-GYP domain-containing protein (c-di-GMP phosphodiesterase class II)